MDMQLHNEAKERGCTPRLLAMLYAAQQSPRPLHRRGWMNAHSVADEHRWEVSRLETEAFRAVEAAHAV
jgi:hypothetical protein